jgi:hypothetical protein
MTANKPWVGASTPVVDPRIGGRLVTPQRCNQSRFV